MLSHIIYKLKSFFARILCSSLLSNYCFQDKSAKYTVCSYSTCGKYIAAGKENGGVTVWNIGTGGILRERKRSNETDAQCITSIDWNPKQNGELAYTDNSGQFGLVENIIETDEHNLDDECDEVEENDNIDFGDSKCLLRIFVSCYTNLYKVYFGHSNRA